MTKNLRNTRLVSEIIIISLTLWLLSYKNPTVSLLPTVQAASFHDVGYEDAWIQFIDQEKGLVQIQTIRSRIAIVFRPKNKENFSRYREGFIAPVTFLCRKNKTDCDIGSQKKAYIGNTEVELILWKTYSKARKLQIRKN